MRLSLPTLLTLALACVFTTPAGAAVVGTDGAGQLRFDAQPGEENKVEITFRSSGAPGNVGEGDRIVITDKSALVVPVGTGSTCTPFDFTKTSGSVSCAASAYSSLALAMGDLNDTVAVESVGERALPVGYPVRVRGFEGNDVLNAGLGDDTLSGDAGRDVIAGGQGADDLFGGAGSDGLIGFEGDDDLRGGPGNDALFGQLGRDLFKGGVGNDVLLARDGERDRGIDCGPGARQRVTIDASDPKARGCDEKGQKRKG